MTKQLDTRLEIRVDKPRVKRWRKAAKAAGIKLAKHIRDAVDGAS